MAKKQTQPRMSVYVPAGLKARMDSVKEPVNWSALACRAFEDKLGEIAAAKETKTMGDVVERLRASARANEDEQHKEGFEAGKVWASEDAEAAQLQRLERFKDGLDAQRNYDWNWWFHEQSSGSAFGPGELLACEIDGDQRPDRILAKEFWERALGDDNSGKPNDPSFARGFAEGALDVWLDVKDKI